jgi:ankyrin repeat protein
LEEMTKIQTEDRTEWTALHLAARGQCNSSHWVRPVSVVNLLLEKGDNIEAKTDTGATALHLGAENGDEKVVGLLLDKGANIDAKDSSNETALHIAARHGHVAVVGLLIKKGSDTGISNLDSGWIDCTGASK